METLSWLMGLVLCCLLLAGSYPVGDGFAQNRDTRRNPNSKLSTSDANAIKEYQKIFESVFTKCDDSYYAESTYIYRTNPKSKGIINDRVDNIDSVVILRLKEVSFNVISHPPDKVDDLNGIQWRGTVGASCVAVQSFDKNTGWSEWARPSGYFCLSSGEFSGEKKRDSPWPFPQTFDYEIDNDYFFKSQKFRKVRVEPTSKPGDPCSVAQ